MKNHVMVCPPSQNQNEVAKPPGSWQYPPPPFFLGQTWGAFSRHVCPVTAGVSFSVRPVPMARRLGTFKKILAETLLLRASSNLQRPNIFEVRQKINKVTAFGEKDK